MRGTKAHDDGRAAAVGGGVCTPSNLDTYKQSAQANTGAASQLMSCLKSCFVNPCSCWAKTSDEKALCGFLFTPSGRAYVPKSTR